VKKNFVLKGNVCYSASRTELKIIEKGFVVSENGISKGAFETLPAQYNDFEVIDYGDNLIIPGLTDLHVHAPQFSFRGLGMDMELLDWLNTYTFPEEAKYKDMEYAKNSYAEFLKALNNSPNTRSVIFATAHVEPTLLLMDELEKIGQVSMVGKVNMDRNSHSDLQEKSAEFSASETRRWLDLTAEKNYENIYPILTPRFIPSCTDELMHKLKEIETDYKIPLQSHLSENQGEIAWVKELVPNSVNYGDAYDKFGLFGQDSPTIMAHCVWSDDTEKALMKKNNVFVAHCPQSNINLASGIAPIRDFLNKNIPVGLGSDIAGGVHMSIFRAMVDAISVSKLYWRLVDSDCKPLTVEEAFYLGTIGGGKFFGNVGSFEDGYEFDAVILDDSKILPGRNDFSVTDRLARCIYLAADDTIHAKYIRGKEVNMI